MQAVRHLQRGECDVAIVGGSSITLHPGVSMAFKKLQMLSPDSACQSFSKNGNGYARSEGVGVLVLTKESLALHPYAKILACGVNQDGWTKEGITFPNGESQFQLYRAVCGEAKAKLQGDDGEGSMCVDYIEAHGTGTQAGDATELKALARQYLAAGGENEEHHLPEKPILLGSVKSNMGHAEGASGIASLCKVCLSYAHEMLPANLHYTFEDRNPKCEGMLGDPKRCKVVTENTPWKNPGIAALSSFGFGGTNAHVLLSGEVKGRRRMMMEQVKDEIPSEHHPEERWQHLNVVYGRTEAGVTKALEGLARMYPSGSRGTSITGPAFVNDFATEFPFVGWAASQNANSKVNFASANELLAPNSPPPVYLVFSGNGGMWPLMGLELYRGSAIYRDTWDRCHAYLTKHHNYTGLEKFLTNPDLKAYDTADGVCGLAALQIGLTNLLNHLGVKIDGYLGHSAGETAMGYIDNCLSLEETMSIAYFRSQCGAKTVDPKNPGGMFAVGCGREEIEGMLANSCGKKYENIDLGCDNDPGLVTLSGSLQEIEEFLETEVKPVLEKAGRKYFARKVPTFGIAYHSRMLEAGLVELKEQIDGLLGEEERVPRSKKWISTCFDDSAQENALESGRFVNSDYHLANFRGTVEFRRATKSIPDNAIVLEVGPHALFRSTMKNNAKDQGKNWVYIPLLNRGANCLESFQTAYAGMVLKGVEFGSDVKKFTSCIVQHPSFRCDRTLFDSLVASWNHEAEYPIPGLNAMMARVPPEVVKQMGKSGAGMSAADTPAMQTLTDVIKAVAIPFDFSSSAEEDDAPSEDAFILDHVIDGTPLMPACGYVWAAWQAWWENRVEEHEAEENDPKSPLPSRDVILRDFVIHQGIRLIDMEKLELIVLLKVHRGGARASHGMENPMGFEIWHGKEEFIAEGVIGGSKEGSTSTVGTVQKQDVVSSTLQNPELGGLPANDFYARIGRNGYCV